MRHAEFDDPRLVPVYDAAFPWSRADDVFLALVGEAGARRVADVGCGTGRLALALAAAGCAVTGVDPSGASLAVARSKPGADRVTWIHGTASSLPDASFDAVVMTSHVAQFLVDDDEWAGALRDVRRSLADGGRLAFDSRDPAARGWERWPREWRRRVALPDGQHVDMWAQVTAVRDGVVDSTIHYAMPDGARLDSQTSLRFRTQDELRRTLADAGFTVEDVYGGWDRHPPGQGDGELLVVARADR